MKFPADSLDTLTTFGYNTRMNNTATLNLYSVPTTSKASSGGFTVAAYDEEDARDTVTEFVGESYASGMTFEPVLMIGYAHFNIEHGMISHYIHEISC